MLHVQFCLADGEACNGIKKVSAYEKKIQTKTRNENVDTDIYMEHYASVE